MSVAKMSWQGKRQPNTSFEFLTKISRHQIVSLSRYTFDMCMNETIYQHYSALKDNRAACDALTIAFPSQASTIYIGCMRIKL